MKEKAAPNPSFVPSPDDVSWGEIYAFCLATPASHGRSGSFARRPSRCRTGCSKRAGSSTWTCPLQERTRHNPRISASSSATPPARIPALTPGDTRQLFAAVLFPVLDAGAGPAVPLGNYDEAFIEAADYADGYAKIVHGTQPVSQNLLAEEPDGLAPVTDLGIRLGWDDEQLLIWQNRQLKADRVGSPDCRQAAAPRRAHGRLRLPHRCPQTS